MSNLHTYSLIKSLYDQRRNYLDTFQPLIFDSISTANFVSASQIQTEIKKKYKIHFPLHLITTACATAKRKDLVEEKVNTDREFRLKPAGKDSIKHLESNSDVERRINALLLDIQTFFIEQGLTKNVGEISDSVKRFLDNNLELFVDILNPEADFEPPSLTKEEEGLIIEYLMDAKVHKPQEFQAFKELTHGSIISGLLYTKNVSELLDTGEMKFKSTRLFLDSNFIFSILGYHTPEQNTSAKELLDLLNDSKFELWVFDFTVDEMCSVLQSYASEEYKFPSNFGIDSIYSVFKRNGWGTSDIWGIIENIDDLMLEHGIRVFSTGINLKNYQSDHENLRSRLTAIKKDKPVTSINHDLAALDQIKKIRSGSVRKLELAKAYFLTSDNALHNFDLHELDHANSGTIAETMLDRLLANILWIKQPSLEVPLHLIIASHSRDLLIDRNVWNRFYDILSKLREKGEITDDQAAALFYRSQIETTLRRFSRSDASKINEHFVAEEIVRASRRVEKEKATLEKEKKQIKEELKLTKTAAKDQAKEHKSKTWNVKKQMRLKALKMAEYAFVFLIFVLGLVEGAVVTYVLISFDLSKIAAVVLPLVGSISIPKIHTKFVFPSFQNYFVPKLQQIFYKKFYSFSDDEEKAKNNLT